MEFLIEIYLILMVICLIFRGIIFHQRDEKWYKTLIPVYNKYVLGKLTDNKKLGLAVGLSALLLRIAFLIYFFIELQLMNDGHVILNQITGNLEVMALPSTATFMRVLDYVVLGFALITWLLWNWMMRSFSIKQTASSWWLFCWAICPAIAYGYFAFVHKKVYIPKQGLLQREVVMRKVK